VAVDLQVDRCRPERLVAVDLNFLWRSTFRSTDADLAKAATVELKLDRHITGSTAT
jgi:hypothetical protein